MVGISQSGNGNKRLITIGQVNHSHASGQAETTGDPDADLRLICGLNPIRKARAKFCQSCFNDWI